MKIQLTFCCFVLSSDAQLLSPALCLAENLRGVVALLYSPVQSCTTVVQPCTPQQSLVCPTLLPLPPTGRLETWRWNNVCTKPAPPPPSPPSLPAAGIKTDQGTNCTTLGHPCPALPWLFRLYWFTKQPESPQIYFIEFRKLMHI